MTQLKIDRKFFANFNSVDKKLSKFDEIILVKSNNCYAIDEGTLIIPEHFDGNFTLDSVNPLERNIRYIKIKSNNCQLILKNGINAQIEVHEDQIEVLSKIKVVGKNGIINVLITFESPFDADNNQEYYCHLPNFNFELNDLRLMNVNPYPLSLKLFCYNSLVINGKVDLLFDDVLKVNINGSSYLLVSKIKTWLPNRFKVNYHHTDPNCANPLVGYVKSDLADSFFTFLSEERLE